MEHIFTYITETCIDPKIWGLFICTSKYFYDGLIERFLVMKFKCMLVRVGSIDCDTNIKDEICKKYTHNHITYILTTNPYLINAHALMDHFGVYEVLGFYIPYIDHNDGCITIDFKSIFLNTLSSTFFVRITPNIRAQLYQSHNVKQITLVESKDITKEMIDTHYWNYSQMKFNDPMYNKDIEMLESDFQFAYHRKYMLQNLCASRFHFPHNILVCVCCGKIHAKYDSSYINYKMSTLSVNEKID
jgi:hypothetical protein